MMIMLVFYLITIMSKPTAISLFSGMGGDSLGMKQAGIEILAYSEKELCRIVCAEKKPSSSRSRRQHTRAEQRLHHRNFKN